jgi:hypothetical protein
MKFRIFYENYSGAKRQVEIDAQGIDDALQFFNSEQLGFLDTIEKVDIRLAEDED